MVEMHIVSSINFIFGLTIGLMFSLFLLTHMSDRTGNLFNRRRQILVQDTAPLWRVVGGAAADRGPRNGDKDGGSNLSDEDLEKIQQNIRPVVFQDSRSHQDDAKIAEDLYSKVRVLCWVMTYPDNLEVKAIHVKRTWAKRCNKLLFMSSVNNTDFPTVGLNVSEGRRHLTAKTMHAFRYIFQNHFNDADWFMKADDDTYVIMENMRYFLSGQDPNDPVYFGHHFKEIVKQGYSSGGAGYVISKEALRRFGEKGNDPKLCREEGRFEDAEFGKCMQNLNERVGNSTDSLGRSRFHCFKPEKHLHGGFPKWYYRFDMHGAQQGLESISDYAISFHYVLPEMMYDLEFYVYHLRPYGINPGLQDLN